MANLWCRVKCKTNGWKRTVHIRTKNDKKANWIKVYPKLSVNRRMAEWNKQIRNHSSMSDWLQRNTTIIRTTSLVVGSRHLDIFSQKTVSQHCPIVFFAESRSKEAWVRWWFSPPFLQLAVFPDHEHCQQCHWAEKDGLYGNSTRPCEIRTAQVCDDWKSVEQSCFDHVCLLRLKWLEDCLKEGKEDAYLDHADMGLLRTVNESVHHSEKQSTKEIDGAPPATVVFVQTGVDVGERNQKVVPT